MTHEKSGTTGMAFRVLVVGWGARLVNDLFRRIDRRSEIRFSYLLHPRHTADNEPGSALADDLHYFFAEPPDSMPPVDRDLLAGLETEGVPTIHNMILGDRVLSRLPYEDVLAYATCLASRLQEAYSQIAPSVVITGFDSLHSGLAMAVARRMSIPVFALNFSVLPPNMACFCTGMAPGTRVEIRERNEDVLLELAERSLRNFEDRAIKARAYIAPPPRSLLGKVASLPKRLHSVASTRRRRRQVNYLKYFERAVKYDVWSAVAHMYRAARGRQATRSLRALDEPPRERFVLFGLHMQPESSIDVWAPFFSNQMWVIELLSRCIPPSHRLLVKVHKSDVANYSRRQFAKMRSLPGVELVMPFADSRAFLERADLVIAIQGTMGLEAALLGKPVIMLGNSPVTEFSSACQAASLRDLPRHVREQLSRSLSPRQTVVSDYARYLAPFFLASDNNWTVRRSDDEIEGYVHMFAALRRHLESGAWPPEFRNDSAA